MRLINANAMKESMISTLERIKRNPKMDGHEQDIIAAIVALSEMIDDAPTVDAVLVRHGRWLPYNSKYGHDEKVYLCNQCNHNVGFKKMNFCPNCGARMDGDGK